MVSLNLVLSSTRFFRRHPWQFWLSILSIALGTAVIVAVDLANASAQRAFALSLDALTGRATHQISAGGTPFDEGFYTVLRTKLGYQHSAPIVAGWLRIEGETFTLLGIDPLAEPMFRNLTTRAAQAQLIPLLTRPDAVLMSQMDAARLGFSRLDRVPVEIQGQTHPVQLIDLYDTTQNVTPEGILITDIATAQTLLDRVGTLDRIDLILNADAAERLRSALPPQLKLDSVGAKQGALKQMTRAFYINLSALSLLAMVVGGFLVYNSIALSVLQRREQLAVARMLGVTGGQLFVHICLEALIIGLLGALLGLFLGVGLAQFLVALVTRTINDLYFVLNVSQLHLATWVILKGVGVALLGTLLAAIGPALEAAHLAPMLVLRRSELERQSRRLFPRLALGGLGLLILGVLVAVWPSEALIVGFGALFLLILGYSLAIPYMSAWLLKRLEATLRWLPTTAKLALRSITAGFSRIALAITALTIAVSATVGVGIMIDSFRHSVSHWLELTLQNDLYVSATSGVASRAEGTLDNFWLERIAHLPGVAAYSTGRSVKLDVDSIPTDTLILSPSVYTTQGFEILAGDTQTAWQAFLAGQNVLISEPLAQHRGLGPGDRVRVFSTLHGELSLPIGAVFRDYGSSQGMLVMPRNLYAEHWQDPALSAIGIKLRNPSQITAVKLLLKRWSKEATRPVSIRSNIEIRQRSLMIFDRTFAITQVLRLLAIVVAFVGVFSALMALLLEKRRENAVLRAVGMTPLQMRGMLLLQSAMIGSLAGVLSVPLGWLMSEMLILVINQRAFGWSMEHHFPLAVLFAAFGTALSSAILAALYPAWRLARAPIASGLREE